MEILPVGLLLVLGVLTPLIVGFLTKSTMSRKTKTTIGIVVSVVLAGVWGFTSGGIVLVLGAGAWAFFESLVLAAGIIYGISQAVYQYIFKGTDLAASVAQVGVTDNETDANGSGFTAEEYPEELNDEEQLGA